jgi:hypothetical protein
VTAVRWSEADVKRFEGRVGRLADRTEAVILSARKPIRLPGMDERMNKTEAAYALVLEAQRMAGEIAEWKFEGIKLRLADRTHYTPDFDVWGVGGELVFHEVKGAKAIFRDDAKVKVKVAAEQFQRFGFLVVIPRKRKDGGGWEITKVGR